MELPIRDPDPIQIRPNKSTQAARWYGYVSAPDRQLQAIEITLTAYSRLDLRTTAIVRSNMD